MATANDQLRVSALYMYPIKSLRGISLQQAQLTAQGLNHDRRFMLREIKVDGSRRNMACYHDPIMVRFLPSLVSSSGEDTATIDNADAVKLRFLPLDNSAAKEIICPLNPDITKLKHTNIAMHGSHASGYMMGEIYDSWFSACIGTNVEFLFIGQNRRQVLGNLSPNESTATVDPQDQGHEQGLGLSDVAPLLVVNETSLDYVSRSLPGDIQANMTKFRPNIVISGAPEEFCEDYWRELTVISSDTSDLPPQTPSKILLTQNCSRCVSLNLDYDTGKFAIGEAGKVLANLSKDRRVDSGAKYSPIFGRYGFLHKDSHGRSVTVGDEVSVTAMNSERTAFYWPHPVPS